MLQTYFAELYRDRLALSALATITSTPLFWMDTLCIPLQTAPPDVPIPDIVLNDIKSKAIDKMNIVYSSSSHTIVLDAELRTIPISASHATKLAYIQCCGWTTRSWTLQEGCLPPSIVFAFSGGLYSREAARLALPQLESPSPESSALDSDFVARQFDSLVQRELWTSSSLRNFSIWDPYRPHFLGEEKTLVRDRFTAVWNELLDRVSSLPADTPAIFANLLGVSAYEVLRKTTERERIALIIRQQQVLPIELLFNTGPRLREKLGGPSSLSRIWPQSQRRVLSQEETPEEWIGLLDMSEVQTKAFKNGWVPASMEGDKCLQTVSAEHYLQVLEHCLQVHRNGVKAIASMYKTLGPHIPMSKFVLDLPCRSTNARTLIAIDRMADEPAYNSQDQSQERILGHCFIYEPSLLRAMYGGHVESAPGCHLSILSRSDQHITTRYISPIQFSRCTEETRSSRNIPTLECQCNCPGCPNGSEHVDILYGQSKDPSRSNYVHTDVVKLIQYTDADDLGPLLSTSSKPLAEVVQGGWLNPVVIFIAHLGMMDALEPYIGTIRPRLIMAAWFIIPLVVYLYQSVVLQQAAKRLLLESINDRGHRSSSLRSQARSFRRRMDATMVAHWPAILFGPALDGLFWIIVKSSEGHGFTIRSKAVLFYQILVIVTWYLMFGTRKEGEWTVKVILWLCKGLWMFWLAIMMYNLFTFGLTWSVFVEFLQKSLALYFGISLEGYIFRYFRGS
jgi:hypothetical protein